MGKSQKMMGWEQPDCLMSPGFEQYVLRVANILKHYNKLRLIKIKKGAFLYVILAAIASSRP